MGVAKIKEIDIQNSIRLALSEKCVIFRANVGVFSTADGRTVSTGLPKDFRICSATENPIAKRYLSK